MPPHGTEDAGLDEPVLARHVHWERGRKRAADMQGAGRVTERRADLPLAHLLRNDEAEVRKPNKLPLVRPPRRESEVALELPGARAARPSLVSNQHAEGLPSPKPLPTVKDEMNPRSLSSFIRC